MTPEKQKEINNHLIEEFYWHGTYPVYVDNRLVNISFERACVLAENENNQQFNPTDAGQLHICEE